MNQGARSVTWRSLAAIAAVLALLFIIVWVGRRSHNSIPKASNASRPVCGVHCGTERWSVKTLSDGDATCVDFTAKHTTISWLVSQPVPERLPEQGRSGTLECQVWQLTGQLVGFKAEDDGDFHIVLADLEHPDLTMIVEIPDPACSGACASARGTDIGRARDTFTQRFGEPVKRFHRVSQTEIVTVIGVGFFDFKHKQTGLALNGVELHPVIGFAVTDSGRH